MSERKLARMSRLLRLGLNLYPPYLGAGIRVREISPDFRRVRVRMGLGWYNRNYVRTQFGGSLYSMTDPFFMLMLMQLLGRDYIVWDKAAEIEFVKPGKGTLHAEFRLDERVLEEIRADAANGEKHLRWLPADVFNAQNEVVARVRKQIYVRLKPEARRPR